MMLYDFRGTLWNRMILGALYEQGQGHTMMLCGFRGTARAVGGAIYGQGQGHIWLNSVRCVGAELRIGLCNISLGAGRCDHSHDVGVACSSGLYVLRTPTSLSVCLSVCQNVDVIICTILFLSLSLRPSSSLATLCLPQPLSTSLHLSPSVFYIFSVSFPSLPPPLPSLALPPSLSPFSL